MINNTKRFNTNTNTNTNTTQGTLNMNNNSSQNNYKGFKQNFNNTSTIKSNTFSSQKVLSKTSTKASASEHGSDSGSDNSDGEQKRIVLPVFNDNNTYITEEDLRKILSYGNISIETIDKTILDTFQKAFIHKSYCLSTYNETDKKKNEKYYGTIDVNLSEFTECIPLQNTSNEVIEWLGDGIIQSVSAIYLFDRFKTQNEGFLTKIRSKLVKTESLSKLALALGFDKHIIMSKHIDVLLNGRKNARILEDSFEAFIGSMMLHFGVTSKKDGFDTCYKFIVSVIEKTIDITELIMTEDNYKDTLMKYFQKNYDGMIPIYEQKALIQTTDKNGVITKKFHIFVKDFSGKIVGEGIAKSKKEAEQLAAKQSLMFFGISNE